MNNFETKLFQYGFVSNMSLESDFRVRNQTLDSSIKELLIYFISNFPSFSIFLY